MFTVFLKCYRNNYFPSFVQFLIWKEVLRLRPDTERKRYIASEKENSSLSDTIFLPSSSRLDSIRIKNKKKIRMVEKRANRLPFPLIFYSSRTVMQNKKEEFICEFLLPCICLLACLRNYPKSITEGFNSSGRHLFILAALTQKNKTNKSEYIYEINFSNVCE